MDKIKHKPVTTPNIIQMEAVECGAASLAIILGYYQKFVPLSELRIACGVSRDGSKASNVIKAARNYGLKAEGLRVEIDKLKELELPYIVFWQFNHFLVVEGFKKNQVYLSDPATGRRTISWQEFDEGYTGVVLTLKPGPNFQKGGNPPNIIKAINSRLKDHYDSLLGSLLAGLFLIIPNIALPVIIGQFIDEVLLEDQIDWFIPLLWGLGIAGVLTFFLQEVQLRYLRRLNLKLGVSMSGKLLWHCLRLPQRFYAQRSAGDIANRIDLNNKLANILSGQMATTTIGLITMIIYGIFLFTYNIPLTLLLVAIAAVNLLVLQWLSRRRINLNMSLSQDYGKVAGVSIQGLKSMESIKASGIESDFFSRWAGYYTKATNKIQKLGVTNQILSVLSPTMKMLANTSVLILGGIAVIKGNLSLGGFVAYTQLMGQFLAPVENLVNFGQQIQELVGDVNRLDDVLINPVDPETEDKVVENFPTPRLKGYLELTNLSFGYNPLEPPLIENFNLSLEPGQRIALVGGSGSGKSTIGKLIAGQDQPLSGEVILDGKPRSAIPRSVIVNSLAMVEQEIFIFGGTVRDNITLWDYTIPEVDIVQAAKDAVIHDIILALPQGYDSELLEQGLNLSGGQRQRLEIARALVINPSILVMDEATSALDAETERQIIYNLRRRNCSCIIIAHRLSTIRDCDEIIVLERGKVLQRGTHEQLWAMGGYYADLIKAEGGIK